MEHPDGEGLQGPTSRTATSQRPSAVSPKKIFAGICHSFGTIGRLGISHRISRLTRTRGGSNCFSPASECRWVHSTTVRGRDKISARKASKSLLRKWRIFARLRCHEIAWQGLGYATSPVLFWANSLSRKANTCLSAKGERNHA